MFPKQLRHRALLVPPLTSKHPTWRQALVTGVCVFALAAIGGCGDESKSLTTSTDAYTLIEHDGSTLISFLEYEVDISHGEPFGIVSLQMAGQPGNFAHWDWPLADWEWFWYDVDGQDNTEKRAKLLDVSWSTPIIDATDDAVLVTFRKSDVVLPNIDLEVRYRFDADRTFSATYIITNNRSELLPGPYSMIGFPGFSNHKWVNGVSSRVEARFPDLGFTSFWEEAQAGNRSEYTLTRDSDESATQPLKGLVAIEAFGKTYTLQAEYRHSDDVAEVFSAHVNNLDI